MKLQPKPFSAIASEAIWSSATHWMLLYPDKPEAEISADTSAAIMRTWITPDLLVYPFTYDANTGAITPVSWPVLPGEEQIEEWRGFAGEPSRLWHAGRQHDQVIAWEAPGYQNISARSGLHPSPRSQINADGIVTPVWVWEADR